MTLIFRVFPFSAHQFYVTQSKGKRARKDTWKVKINKVNKDYLMIVSNPSALKAMFVGHIFSSLDVHSGNVSQNENFLNLNPFWYEEQTSPRSS